MSDVDTKEDDGDAKGNCDWCDDDILFSTALADGGNFFCSDDCMERRGRRMTPSYTYKLSDHIRQASNFIPLTKKDVEEMYPGFDVEQALPDEFIITKRGLNGE